MKCSVSSGTIFLVVLFHVYARAESRRFAPQSARASKFGTARVSASWGFRGDAKAPRGKRRGLHSILGRKGLFHGSYADDLCRSGLFRLRGAAHAAAAGLPNELFNKPSLRGPRLAAGTQAPASSFLVHTVLLSLRGGSPSPAPFLPMELYKYRFIACFFNDFCGLYRNMMAYVVPATSKILRWARAFSVEAVRLRRGGGPGGALAVWGDGRMDGRVCIVTGANRYVISLSHHLWRAVSSEEPVSVQGLWLVIFQLVFTRLQSKSSRRASPSRTSRFSD